MKDKRLAGYIVIEDGNICSSSNTKGDCAPRAVDELMARLDGSCIDRLFVFNRARTDEQWAKNLEVMTKISRSLYIPMVAGGDIARFEDVKKLIYAGASGVLISASTQGSADLIREAALRFGKDRVYAAFDDKSLAEGRFSGEEYITGCVIMDPSLSQDKSAAIDVPYYVYVPGGKAGDTDLLKKCLEPKAAAGIAVDIFEDFDINALTDGLGLANEPPVRFKSAIPWEELIKNDSGLIPVVVQDFKTDEVLMVAYMNEEAYEATMATGRMTYYSRSRRQLWLKGETSGHFQYVRSIHADCDKDTLLARVDQIGAACHTGSHSCFFNELARADVHSKNPRRVLDEVYATILDRKANPKEGSYTNYLFDKGIDKILKKVGEEATEIVIAAKNPDASELKYEISDFLYHLMVLMAQRGVTWEEIAEELSGR